MSGSQAICICTCIYQCGCTFLWCILSPFHTLLPTGLLGCAHCALSIVIYRFLNSAALDTGCFFNIGWTILIFSHFLFVLQPLGFNWGKVLIALSSQHFLNVNKRALMFGRCMCPFPHDHRAFMESSMQLPTIRCYLLRILSHSQTTSMYCVSPSTISISGFI